MMTKRLGVGESKKEREWSWGEDMWWDWRLNRRWPGRILQGQSDQKCVKSQDYLISNLKLFAFMCYKILSVS